MQADTPSLLRKTYSFLETTLLDGHPDFSQDFRHAKLREAQQQHQFWLPCQTYQGQTAPVRLSASTVAEVFVVLCRPFGSPLKSCLKSWKAESQGIQTLFSVWVYRTVFEGLDNNLVWYQHYWFNVFATSCITAELRKRDRKSLDVLSN